MLFDGVLLGGDSSLLYKGAYEQRDGKFEAIVRTSGWRSVSSSGRPSEGTIYVWFWLHANRKSRADIASRYRNFTRPFTPTASSTNV